MCGSALDTTDRVRETDVLDGFVPGTNVRTDAGDCAVEELKTGDQTIVCHGGLATVRSVKPVPVPKAAVQGATVEIAAGALGNDLPRETLTLGRDQWVVISNPILQRLFDCRSAAVRASELCVCAGVRTVPAKDATELVEVGFETPHKVYCSGLGIVAGGAGALPADLPAIQQQDLAVLLKTTATGCPFS